MDTVSLYLENDFFAGEDSEYTNGLKLTWSSAIHDNYPDVWPHRWFYPLIRLLPFEKSPDRQKNISISFGQNIYTPVDIKATELIKDDRPYAGITYLSIGFHNRFERDMDSLEAYIGIVGPHSYAEECQAEVHKLFNYVKPQGWENQLSDEPVLGIVYEHKKKLTQSGISGGLGHALVLNTGVGLGNALTYYNLGLNLRIGWNVPNDFGNSPIRPVSSINAAFDNTDSSYYAQNRIGVYLFASSEGRAVLRNIFLDGNTFTDSPSVTKNPLVADCMTGIGIVTGRTQICFAYVYRTKEFDTQKDPQKFGSVNISVSY